MVGAMPSPYAYQKKGTGVASSSSSMAKNGTTPEWIHEWRAGSKFFCGRGFCHTTNTTPRATAEGTEIQFVRLWNRVKPAGAATRLWWCRLSLVLKKGPAQEDQVFWQINGLLVRGWVGGERRNKLLGRLRLEGGTLLLC